MENGTVDKGLVWKSAGILDEHFKSQSDHVKIC